MNRADSNCLVNRAASTPECSPYMGAGDLQSYVCKAHQSIELAVPEKGSNMLPKQPTGNLEREFVCVRVSLETPDRLQPLTSRSDAHTLHRKETDALFISSTFALLDDILRK